jgi:quercetin dioxygenase-like cupin family protein
MAATRVLKATIITASQAASYWQPKPANGYVSVYSCPNTNNPEHNYSFGLQVIAANSYVREHSHTEANTTEVIHVLSGSGTAIIESQHYEMKPGTTFTIPAHITHKFINNSSTEELSFNWIISPPGLEKFFAQVGRARDVNNPGLAPEPFERPEEECVDSNHGMKA